MSILDGKAVVITGAGRGPASPVPSPSAAGDAKWRAKRSGSIVAEVMITFRSGRCGRIRLR